ncbi:MAG: hypothetical protein KC912_24315 [Proteobacteria bacterium]|nr:hypothetical protein [Pseudomonadota bacterium]
MNDDLTDWLQRGGDHRLIAGEDELSPYRVSLHVRNSTPFGSCTASNPGVRGLEAARVAFDQWKASGRSDAVIEELQQKTRDELRETFTLSPGTSIVLTPSGTDVLYLLNALVHQRDRHAHHVVVGASELGGGTVRASEGKTFSAQRPFGGDLEIGLPLEGVAERCSAEAVYLREAAGMRLDLDAIDHVVEQRVHAAAAPDTVVVVHLVAHSKTGLRAPSFDLGKRLKQRYGNRVLIFVDAAQGRVAPADVRLALTCGFVVMFTGSKFYSGPPFSGALFLPGEWAGDPGPIPAALHSWFDAASLPTAWHLARASLSHASNPGLMLRWRAAMAEIIAYHAIVPRRRAAVYATFAGAVHEILGPDGPIDLEFPRPPTHGLVTGLGAFPTVFGFRVRDEHGWLDTPRMKTLHRLLDEDESGPFGAHHLGQPVALGPPGEDRRVLLRVALGARTVTDLAREPDAGGRWMRGRIRALRAKIEHLLSEGLEHSDG